MKKNGTMIVIAALVSLVPMWVVEADEKVIIVAHEQGESGGAGGFSPQILWLAMSPIEKAVSYEDEVKKDLVTFDFDDNSLNLIGAMGYGGEKNGIRFGGGGWAGYRQFQSSPFQRTITDSARIAAEGDSIVDSTVVLHTVVAYGGFLVEKSFTFDRINALVGGLIGGGALVLGKTHEPHSGSVFHKVNTIDTNDENGENNDSLYGEWAVAPLMAYDIHGGATFSVTPWLHAGIDLSMLVFHSSLGFGFGHDSFWMWNPAARFRIMFGNLG